MSHTVRRRRTAFAIGALLSGVGALPILAASAAPAAPAVLAAERAYPSARAALSASVSYLDLDGHRVDTVPRDAPFAIEVALVNEAGSDPPAGLTLAGWLRPTSDSNLECVQAARAWRATGRVPIGAIDLNGPVLGVLDELGSLVVVDPELDLASANLIAATRFDERPSAFVADPAAGRFLVALPGAGRVESLALAGGDRTSLAGDLADPSDLIPLDDARFWVLERGTGDVSRIADGERDRVLPLGAEALHAGINGHAFAARGARGAWLLGRRDGETLLSIDGEGVDDAVPLGDERDVAGLALLRLGRLSIHYRDADAAAGPPIELGLPADGPATRLAASPDGRWLFAWTPRGGPVAIIDVARGRLLQGVGAGSPIADVHVGTRAAFLMLADQTRIGAVDLGSLRADEAANVREVALGQASTSRVADARLLSALPPGDDVLAVHADSYTGFVVHDRSVMGDAPPMTAIRLRGGVPWQVAAIDRGFREVETGRFRAVARLPASGSHELVVSTGIGGLSSCFEVPAAAPSAPPPAEPGRISALAPGAASAPANPLVTGAPRTDAGAGQRLQFADADGGSSGELVGELTFSALQSSWRARAELATDADGVSLQRYALPPLGAIVVTAAVAGRESGAERSFRPLLLELER